VLAFFFAVGVPLVIGDSLNGSMGKSVPNATLPEIDADYENDDQDRKIQSCDMPPCPPGEMCIQVCPESVPQ
jgi:hypothetical protein